MRIICIVLHFLTLTFLLIIVIIINFKLIIGKLLTLSKKCQGIVIKRIQVYICDQNIGFSF